MEPNIFFSALSKTLLTSVGQGLIIYAIVKVLLNSAPTLSAERRFRFLYGAMLLIFAGFIISLVRTYNAEIVSAETFASQLSVVTEYPNQQALARSFYSNTDYTKWIAALYFTGIIIQSTIILAGLYQLRMFRRKSKLWTDKVWEERLQHLCLKLNIGKKVKLHLAERVFSPFTAGFIKPMVIFPIAMLNRLSPEQVEAILLHELGHIKRNDYILNIFHKVIETILFFNPFMWLLSIEIRKEREFACDDLVMEYTKNTTQYARALLHIAEGNLKNCSFGIAASGENKFSLLTRIKRLKNMKTQQNNPKSGLLALLSIAAAFVSLACIIPTETPILQAGKKPTVKKVRPVSFRYNTEPEIPVLKPLPSSLKLKVALKALPPLSADTDTNHVNEYFKSAEWKKHMEDIKSHAAEIKKQFDSPEWKKHIQDMKVNSEEMKKHFESPEWKKQMQDMKVHTEEMKKHFDSPEWKKQMQEMKVNALAMQKEFNSPEWKKKMEDMKAHSMEMKKEFDSPEWKKKIDEMKELSIEMKKQFDSPEWKKKIEEMKINSEEMRKQFETPEWKKQIEEIKKMAKEMKLETEKTEKKTVTPKN